MIDLRPVAYVIGLLVSAMGLFMLFPMALDMADGNPHWRAFFRSSVICLVAGGAMAIAGQWCDQRVDTATDIPADNGSLGRDARLWGVAPHSWCAGT